MPDTEARLRAALDYEPTEAEMEERLKAIAMGGGIEDDYACCLIRLERIHDALSTPPAPAAEPDRMPKGYRRIEAYTNDLEIVAMEWPKDGDETHNCDALGCSSVEHVKYRAEIPGWQLGQDEPQAASEAAIRADQRIDSRQVSRDFLLLPYHRKVEVMWSLGAIDPKDGTDLPHSIWIECMMRVRDAGLLPQLAAAIERGQSAEGGEGKR